MHSYAHDEPSIDSSDKPLPRVRAIDEPSAELLDRALVGWQRFLSTFEGGLDD
ncbi:hypothetical protein [Streptomyces sp. NBC_00091]|uniref:hypothetical protein n=1 Tax=Streptomyces sp. NBC_00091 TaxID=2975648 RepID=UPI0022534F0F|nr:hypothetical protein [Streptomyces sp. NBC_00091]MCX5376859.1 hypothetical protein [Streptomyces sp. NBC_00091]